MEPRRIGILGFDSVQALDFIGPADAFASDVFASEPVYEVVAIGLRGRSFTASSGITFSAQYTAKSAPDLDTLIVPGGSGLRLSDTGALAAEWVAERASSTRRIVTVCTGIYGVAPTGLLDGRRATTHWSAVRDVERRFPRVRLDPEAVYTKDGPFYSSAGITAGIDLALALIEEDCGPQVALAVAREMVVFYKRPGGQTQFSEPLQFQFQSADQFGELAAWVRTHLRSRITVERMAKHACMSVRHFSREFKTQFGVTPAAFVEATRIAEASERLASQRMSISAIARSVGYRSEDVFRRAFERRFGVSPREYRERFDVTASPFAAD